MLTPLPIDPLLERVVRTLREGPNLVLEAPPGAGKTTRVPRALFDAGFAEHGEIVVLEPRRLAARLASRRVAEELGSRLGETVGYTVRFENVSSKATRIRFVTEGLLVRQLLEEPDLSHVSTVLLDEFHERHITTDLSLALLLALQKRARPDLRLVVMSATIDTDAIASFLDAPTLRAEGRRFEVGIDYLARADDRPLERQVVSAVRQLVVKDLDGDVLVFLPGTAEIRRAQAACEPLAQEANLLVVPLYGDLSPAEQDRAVQPASRRKIILSTNVAETSVTIDGVTAVVDAGLARIAGHAPWSGLPTLRVMPISRASATQRAGRAGRTRPGQCMRLYTRHDHDARPAFETPEIKRVDLSEAALALHAAGASDLASFSWFEPPERAALLAADTLLVRLGAVDEKGALTATGKRMLAFPIHPRQARLVVEAEARGAAEAGCTIAALLGERSIRAKSGAGRGRASEGPGDSGPSDLLADLELFERAAAAGFDRDHLHAMAIDAGAARAIARSGDQLRRRCARRASGAPLQPGRGGLAADREQALLVSILAAYPDRVAKRRVVAARHAQTSAGDLAMAGGGAATLSPSSVVLSAPFLVAVDAEERKNAPALVRIASAVEPEFLLELFPDKVEDTTEVLWNQSAERADAVSRLIYDGLVLEETRREPPSEEASKVLAQAALALGPRSFVEGSLLDRWLARARFVATALPGFVAPSADDVRDALVNLCEGRRSFAELREASLLSALRARLPPKAAADLDAWAPERVRLLRGRETKVEYEAGKPPFIASRLQDFFGMREAPRIADGRIGLVVHLLAPNQRAVQVTADLAGFWARHYPDLRRELGRRYPRHTWPEDPMKP